jgi:hypothetical protein
VGFYAVTAVVAQALGFIVPPRWGHEVSGIIAPITLQLVVGALSADSLWWLAGWRSWKEMGWPGLAPGLGGFGRGLCLGLAMALAALLLEITVGGARLALTGETIAIYGRSAVTLIGALAVAALSEELLFRGFPLVRLADVMGPVGASLLLALGFAGLHGVNPGVTLLGLVNVAVASLSLSAIFFRLGGMPAAWGAHLGWNAGLGAGVDAPVSGIAFHVPGIEYSASGPAWITGGTFGPEGGVIGTLVMVVVAVWVGKDLIMVSGARGPGSGSQEAA